MNRIVSDVVIIVYLLPPTRPAPLLADFTFFANCCLAGFAEDLAALEAAFFLSADSFFFLLASLIAFSRSAFLRAGFWFFLAWISAHDWPATPRWVLRARRDLLRASISVMVPF